MCLRDLDETSQLGRVAMLELLVGRDSVSGEGLDAAVRPWLRVAADFVRARQAELARAVRRGRGARRRAG